MGNKTLYACEDHIDMALDDFVNEYEDAPELFLATIKKKCDYCDKYAKYELKDFQE